MKIVYTLHAQEKLKRKDVKKYKITKRLTKKILEKPETKNRTKYGDYSAISVLDIEHDLRIIYDIIDKDLKVITFHISRKGRYR